MAHLSLWLLGTFEATLADRPVTAFDYDKVRALLAYLAVEADRPHRRETLAGLLWPERPERRAHQSLSQALFKLRQAIGDPAAEMPFLHITPQTLQFNPASDHWLDVTALTALLTACQTHPHRRLASCAACMARLQQAVSLYRGPFLAGFSLGDSPAFEEWVVLTRERLHRRVYEAHGQLAGYFAGQRAYAQALHHARQQVELEPWREEGQRQLMRLQALSGQRSAALAQFETCQRLLAAELGLEPEAETLALYEQIREGVLSPKEQTGERREEISLTAPLLPRPPAALPCVARETELDQLNQYLTQALAGQGQLLFVTGGPGRGKTTLIWEFARRAQAAQPELVVAGGLGNAHTGVGDPYLPFREILGQLSGDEEAIAAIGTITPTAAERLGVVLPATLQALPEVGPDLIGTFVPGEALLQRAAGLGAGPDRPAWLAKLEQHVERQVAWRRSTPPPLQGDLFEQYSRLLRGLAERQPLLLLLDDLQWADQSSINLLFHLGRRLAGSRMLLVGAYRPAEVAIGYPPQRHPLEPVLNEFKRLFGPIEIDLSLAAERRFVDALLDMEPNGLDETFRQTLYRQTGGHPLFTVELLRGMKERGDLITDQTGRWVAGPALDWETLPARVEAVIAERLERLPAELREVLTVASVEGEIFTAEVVAALRSVDPADMVHQLSDSLERTHRLVAAQGVRQQGDRHLSRYRFRHSLFQKYLYHHLDPAERVYLHESVGLTLERLYAEAAGTQAVPLARHFQEAGLTEQAIHYLSRAGEQAVRLSANEEAISHFRRALALLATRPDSAARAQQEIELQLALAVPYLVSKGYGAPEAGEAYNRAWALCKEWGESPQQFPVLWSLAVFYGARADYGTSLEIASQLLSTAERLGDPVQVALGHWLMGWRLFFGGEFGAAITHLEQAISFYDPEQHQTLAFLYGQDFGVGARSVATWTLWLLGYPDRARRYSEEALALAEALSHPMSLAFAQVYAATLAVFCQDSASAQSYAEASIELTTRHRVLYWLAGGLFCLGWALNEQGQVEAGVAAIGKSLTANQETGTKTCQTLQLAGLAELYAKTGQVEAGLAAVAEALTFVDLTGERFYEAELYRLKGELLGQTDPAADPEVEACFRRAIELARSQQAKSLELRATLSLARWLQQKGQAAPARQMLAEIYGWFSEGFDTVDLQAAKALLRELEKS